MAQVYGIYNGKEVCLPHPYIPCACCNDMNMGEEACPHAKDVCVYCCSNCSFPDEACDGTHDQEEDSE